MSALACRSYECSTSLLVCNLNTQADPSVGAFRDYVFCTKMSIVSNAASAHTSPLFEVEEPHEFTQPPESGVWAINLSSRWVLGVAAVLAMLLLMNLWRLTRSDGGRTKRKYAKVSADSEEFTDHEAQAINVEDEL